MDAEQAMEQAKVSCELEGSKIIPEYTRLVRAVLNKEMTDEEFNRKVKSIILQGKQQD